MEDKQRAEVNVLLERADEAVSRSRETGLTAHGVAYELRDGIRYLTKAVKVLSEELGQRDRETGDVVPTPSDARVLTGNSVHALYDALRYANAVLQNRFLQSPMTAVGMNHVENELTIKLAFGVILRIKLPASSEMSFQVEVNDGKTGR